MNLKAKGIAGERQLIHMFWAAGWASFRCAASGSIKYAVPDLIAGNNIRKLAIEVKTVAGKYKYFEEREIDELLQFSRIFGSEAWLAIKFKNKGWHFISPEDLQKKGKMYSASLDLCNLRGLSFEELTKKN